MFRHLASLLICVCFAFPAKADLIYSISFDSTGASLNSNLVLATGASQVVNVYFHESFGAADVPILDLIGGVNGLTAANFRVNRGGAGASQIGGASGNTLFDLGPTVNFAPAFATVEQEILVNNPVFASGTPTPGPGIRTVQLGTITVTASAVVGDVNTFSLADFNPTAGINDFIIDNLANTFDVSVDGLLTFGVLTVTAVPEPSAIVLVSLLGMGAAGYRFRNRNAKRKSNVS